MNYMEATDDIFGFVKLKVEETSAELAFIINQIFWGQNHSEKNPDYSKPFLEIYRKTNFEERQSFTFDSKRRFRNYGGCYIKLHVPKNKTQSFTNYELFLSSLKNKIAGRETTNGAIFRDGQITPITTDGVKFAFLGLLALNYEYDDIF